MIMSKNSVNNLQVSGFAIKDAEKKQFNNMTLVKFAISIARTEKDKDGKDVRKSSILNFEAWRKNENASSLDCIKKGELVTVEGYFAPDEYEKDGKKQQVTRLICTKAYPTPEKAETGKEG